VLLGLAVLRTRSTRLAFLLVMNLVFYASATPWFVLVLLAPSLVDYVCAIRIEEAVEQRERRGWLLLSLISTLGILLYFKYAGFFVDSIAALFGVSSAPLALVVPLGISFFAFKTMSYTIDVYRGDLRACRNPWHYTMFVSFFPELVSGPIVRASVFLPQMDRSLHLSWRGTRIGAQMILLGLSKKLLVADRLAVFVDPVFGQPQLYSGATVLSAVVAYSLQIYCDFSGYTDMAIGLAKIIGFDLPENFHMPYLAASITEFWRRWHITLSQWLRDYLYIPLGGSRRGTLRTYVNLIVTMLLGGLWHGASWTFVLWGLFHGCGLAVHKMLTRHRPSLVVLPRPIRLVMGWAMTYTFVCAGWILFRSSSFSAAAMVFRKVAGMAPGGISWFYLPLWLLVPVVAAAHAFGYVAARQAERDTAIVGVGDGGKASGSHGARWGSWSVVPRYAFAGAIVVTLWVTLLFLFTPLHRSPFIYFQF
jgi:alginate O-acetyltransferase complex protein AlgI